MNEKHPLMNLTNNERSIELFHNGVKTGEHLIIDVTTGKVKKFITKENTVIQYID